MKLIALLIIGTVLFAGCLNSQQSTPVNNGTEEINNIPPLPPSDNARVNQMNLTCTEACIAKNFAHGTCGGQAVVENPSPACSAGETSIGETTDCTIYTPQGPLIGATKTCCCG